MSVAAIEPEPVPLVTDDAGRLVVPATRVSLDILVAAFKRGESPEAVHEDYDSVSLADVHATFSYYLRHMPDVEQYLRGQEELSDKLRTQVEANSGAEGLRAKLLARLNA